MSKPDTTTYALLGLLHRHPWSAYELARFMRQSMLRAVWPRAESRLYEGMKKLVKLDFATTSTEATGKRKRTVYTITPGGREALAQWTLEPGRDVVFEHEALLKLAYADQHGISGVQQALDNIDRSTALDVQACIDGFDELAVRLEQAQEEETPPALNLLVNAFVLQVLQARLDWLEQAREFIRDWQDVASDAGKRADAAAYYREAAEALRKRLEPSEK